MALQSEVSPPIVGDTNKDTKIDGDTKSNEGDTSQSTEDEVDLEEGEILDSGGEEEDAKENAQSQLKEALDLKCLQSIEKLAASPAKTDAAVENNKININSRRRAKKMYMDHDLVEDNEGDEAWYPPSPKFKKKSSKFSDGPIDYRKELAAYIGSPSSSPERKHGRSEKSRKKKSSKSKKSGDRKAIKRNDTKGSRFSKTRKKENVRRMCKFFKEGKCSKGSDCQFVHFTGPPKKRELCKFYISGSCFKGKSCSYMHDDFPCKFFHTGLKCFADENCRFSHAPLNDEAKALLDDYIGGGGHHGNNDDYDNRKRHRSRSRTPEPQPPPPKRICILGSPPRHIKEAEETKCWQDEMMMLYRQQMHPDFEIRFSPQREPVSPSHFTKPNFYAETLQNSPISHKHLSRAEANSPGSMHRFPHGIPESTDAYIGSCIKIEDEDNWNSVNDHIQKFSAPHEMTQIKVEPTIKQEPDFASDVKFDETTQFSQMGSPMNFRASSPSHVPPADDDDQEDYDGGDANDGDSDSSTIENTSAHGSPERGDAPEDSMESPKPLPPPIVIPPHLPRKQRELFLRIQQHQRQNALGSLERSENIELEKEESEEESEKPVEKEPSKYYSSEEEEDDDDDDTDRPLKNALRKLHQAPPPQAPAAKPAINLMQMLSKITHPNENKPLTDAQHPQGAFWESILTGAVVPPNNASQTIASTPSTRRRTLLPNPKMPIAEKKEPAVPKDPRLKNRDPRTLASNSSNVTSIVLPVKTNTTDIIMPPMLPLVPITTPPQPQISDIKKLFPKPVVNEPPKEDIPYKLHGIFTKPPNYMPYIHASQSDPKLLNDPRLRRHIMQVIPGSHTNDSGIESTKEFPLVKSAPVKEAPPPIPPLLLQYAKPEGKLNINIFETSSSTKTSTDVPKLVEPRLITAARRLSDPRTRTRDSLLDQLCNSGSNTPPHLTIVEPCLTPPHLQEFKSAPILENALSEPVPEKRWLPPVLEKNWLPPVLEKNPLPTETSSLEEESEKSLLLPELKNIENASDMPSPLPSLTEQSSVESADLLIEKTVVAAKKVMPKTASHLPRAIADPRMAKLHHPVDPRRRRVPSDTSAKCSSVVQIKSASESAPLPQSSLIETPDSADSVTTEIAEETGSQEKSCSIPKKKTSEKSEEKKKTVHRNRKSSMDYASPLNSCDDTNSAKTLGFNAYNQRQRTAKPVTDIASSLSNVSVVPADIPEATPNSEFLLSDNSNQDCDSNDVNLKDMFKTIDPTASPFC